MKNGEPNIDPTSPMEGNAALNNSTADQDATVYGASSLAGPKPSLPDIAPEASFEPLRAVRQSMPTLSAGPLSAGGMRRTVSERRRRAFLSDVPPSPAVSQVRQMRDGTSLGLEGLARYNTWLNVLLIFVPLGIFAHVFDLGQVFVFCSCFVGMIPLAMHLSRATEDIADRTNDGFGALVNVTFGNAVEIILSISALRAGRLSLVQNTLAGSILSNLLLGAFFQSIFTLCGDADASPF